MTIASLYRTAPVGAGPVGAGPVGAGPVGAGPVGAGPVGAGPVGGEHQPDFLNTAATGSTSLDPEHVLAAGQALELAAGRRRGRRFGPRPLDVDLLCFGDQVSTRPELTLPHPRLAERRFVLVPLAEIAPALRVPPEGRTVSELLRATSDTSRVDRIRWTWTFSRSAPS